MLIVWLGGLDGYKKKKDKANKCKNKIKQSIAKVRRKWQGRSWMEKNWRNKHKHNKHALIRK